MKIHGGGFGQLLKGGKGVIAKSRLFSDGERNITSWKRRHLTNDERRESRQREKEMQEGWEGDMASRDGWMEGCSDRVRDWSFGSRVCDKDVDGGRWLGCRCGGKECMCGCNGGGDAGGRAGRPEKAVGGVEGWDVVGWDL